MNAPEVVECSWTTGLSFLDDLTEAPCRPLSLPSAPVLYVPPWAYEILQKQGSV